MQNIDPKAVAQRLVQLRAYHQITQAELADSVGIDRSSYSKIEQGKKPLKAEMAYSIAERWGVTMDFLYRGRLAELPHKMAEAFMNNLTKEQP